MNDINKPPKKSKKDKPLKRGRPKAKFLKVDYRPSMRDVMLDLSRVGKSLTQIAVALSEEYSMPIVADTLIQWDKSAGETYSRHLKLCRTYAQAYHEDILDKMISGTNKASSSEIEAQKWKLKTLFSDWGDKASKIEISQTETMGDKELESKVISLLKQTGQLPPTKLKAVSNNDDKK